MSENESIHLGPMRWRQEEWVCFIFIALFLCLFLLIAGYPIIDWDSLRYLQGALYLSVDWVGLAPLSQLMSPLVKLTGAWGFPILQITLLTYVLVSFLKFFDRNFIVAILSILISGAGLFAIEVMMDIYTVIGLLALFLILNNRRDILLYLILGLCYIAHYENILLFPFCAVVYWIIFQRKSFNATLLPTLLIFAIGIGGILLDHYKHEGRVRLFSKIKDTMLACCVMANNPDIVESYMGVYPGSMISRHRSLYDWALETKENCVHTLLWNDTGNKKEEGLCFLALRDNDVNEASKEFVSYAFREYKWSLLKNALRSSFLFLVRPGIDIGMGNDGLPIDKLIKSFVPWQYQYARHSLQYRGGLTVIPYKAFYAVSFYSTFSLMGLFLFFSIINHQLRGSMVYSFVIFVFMIMLANAFGSSNFSGSYVRYQLRMMLLPALAAILGLMDMGRILFRQKAQE